MTDFAKEIISRLSPEGKLNAEFDRALDTYGRIRVLEDKIEKLEAERDHYRKLWLMGE